MCRCPIHINTQTANTFINGLGNTAFCKAKTSEKNLHRLTIDIWLNNSATIILPYVKEYSSEYSDSAFKVEDTTVSRR